MNQFIGGPVDMTPPAYWRGVHKLQEEMGELQQVLGKLCTYPLNNHPDKEDWRKKLIEELADVTAALSYFTNVNLTLLEAEKIAARANVKFAKFNQWGLIGVRPDGSK